jgi:hypothetical protein
MTLIGNLVLQKGWAIKTTIPAIGKETEKSRFLNQNEDRARKLHRWNSLTSILYYTYWALKGADQRPHFLLHQVEMVIENPARDQRY